MVNEWEASDWQAFFDERAAISEYDGGMTRQLAEVGAFSACLAEYQRQNPGTPVKDAKMALAGFGVRYPKV